MTAVPSSNVPLLWIVDTGLMATNAIIWLLWLLPQSIGQPYHIPKACRYVDSWCVVASGTLLGRLLRDYQWPEGSWNRLLGDRWIPVYLYPQVTGLVMSQTHHQLPWTFLLSSSILSQFQMLKYTKLQVRKIFKDMEKKKITRRVQAMAVFSAVFHTVKIAQATKGPGWMTGISQAPVVMSNPEDVRIWPLVTGV